MSADVYTDQVKKTFMIEVVATECLIRMVKLNDQRLAVLHMRFVDISLTAKSVLVWYL